MSDDVRELGGSRVMELAAEGKLLASERDATDVIGDAFGVQPDWIAIPVSRLPEAFFELRTRLAGDMLQKFTTYGFRVAIVGDVSGHVERSEALAAFVRESNRGAQVWFVADGAELEQRLAKAG